MENNYTYLKLLQSKDISFWDVKAYLQRSVSSQYKMERLQNLLIEHSKKTKLFEKPEENFKILGVNNQDGLFDAYIEKGKNINQPYKKVEDGYFAYNPYRINVGSIGLKSDKQKYDYISPAYVVFSCKGDLLPKYLEILLKTEYFAQAIRHNTTGSVRQTLGFDNLCNILIPLPTIEKQKELVSNYEYLQNLAIQKEENAKKIENSIDEYLLSELGIDNIEKAKDEKSLFHTVSYNELNTWDVKSLSNIQTFLKSKIYNNYRMQQILSINPRTTIPTNICISFIPMENIDEKYGEIKKLEEKNSNTAKGYTKFLENDIIWAKITPCMQNGKSVIVQGLLNGYGCGSTEFHVIRNNKSNELIRGNYIYFLLRMKMLLTMAKKTFTGACGQQRVPANFLEELIIPIPPIDIQDKLISSIMAKKDNIKKLRNESKQLKQQAILNFEQEVFN